MPQEELPSHIPPPPPDPVPSSSSAAPNAAMPPLPTPPPGSASVPPPPSSPASPSVPPPSLSGPATRTPPSPEIQPANNPWITFWVVIVVFFWLTQSLFATVVVAGIGIRLMRRRRRTSVSGVPAPPRSPRNPKTGLMVALGGVIFAFLPLINVVLSPHNDYEGPDLRPLLMILTAPAGLVIVIIGLVMSARASRRPGGMPPHMQGFKQE